MERWEQIKRRESESTDCKAFVERVPEAKRRRTKKRAKVSEVEQLSIAHSVLVEKEYQADVAKGMRISVPRVSAIVKKVSQNKNVFDDMRLRHSEEENRRSIIRQQILYMMEQRKYIDSCDMVKAYIEAQTELKPKRSEIYRAMKDQLHMSFRKVRKGPIYLNSDKNLILRQQAALKVLELLNMGKILINLDESWINETDFRRMKWRPPGDSNVQPALQLSPRITLIAALDTLGNAYLTLTQANSNNKTMEIYFHQLAAKLDRERPSWREDSVIITDNAPYHVSASTQRVLQDLRIPILFFGPHSYNIAVCELFFAFVKSTHLNPTFMPTGKK